MKNYKYLIILVVLLAVVYWKWWMPGIKVATDFPIVSLSDLRLQLDFPRTWASRGSLGFGGYSVFTLWFWPMNFLIGILANLGLSFGSLERIVFIIPTLVIGACSVWGLLSNYNLSKSSKFVASFFYLTNTYILLLIDGGQLSIALAYAWFPASYLFFERSLNKDLKNKILSGLGIWVLGILDIRFLFILGILLIVRFIFVEKKEWITSSLIAGIMLIGLNAYWILPLIKFPVSGQIFSGLTKNFDLSFTQLKNSISLLQPHWYQNVFGKLSAFRKEFLLIPIIAFAAPILKRKNHEIWFWTFIALISVFLTKGTNPPFSEIYPWLFTNIPGFSLFRDSTKFFFLVALSYSVLIAFTLDYLYNKFPRYKIMFSFTLLVYLIFLIRPVYLGKMTGTFSNPRYEKEYSVLSQQIQNDSDFGKIFWIPSRPPLGYSSIVHPSLEASNLESMRPFEVSTVGNYETQNFIREGNYMGELFSIVGIKYLSYPSLDPKRDDMSKQKVDYYNTFLDQISNLSWIDQKISDNPVPVFKTKESKDKFFLSANTYFVVGSDAIYQEIKTLRGKLSDNALVFSEENPSVINKLFQIPQAKIVLFGKNKLDLTLSFIKNGDLVFPASNLGPSPSINSKSLGWWERGPSDLLWWRDFIQQKYGIDNLDFDYGGGWAISEGNATLQISNAKFGKGKILFARVMKSSKSGQIEFRQNNLKIGEINTEIAVPEKIAIKLTGHDKVPDIINSYDKADFSWVEVGYLISDTNLEIRTRGNINVVNSLVAVSKNDLDQLEVNANTLYRDNKVVDWNSLNDPDKEKLLSANLNASVSFKEISATHYRVTIKGLNNPATLVFSDSYDGLWNLNGKSSYPLFSIINGFPVTKDGIYDLYFTPQKYVYFGLLISGVTLLISILTLFNHSQWFIFRKKQA